MVVDFTAEWCGPCQRIAPKIETMAINLREQVHTLHTRTHTHTHTHTLTRHARTIILARTGTLRTVTHGPVAAPCVHDRAHTRSYAHWYGCVQVVFLKVDVDENEETSAACGINCMPTFQLFKNGGKVGEIEGADEARLRALIDEKLGAAEAEAEAGGM